MTSGAISMPNQETPPRPLRVAVALTPSALGAVDGSTTYIVVDVIRATTTLCVHFERGARRVLVAPEIAAARQAHAALQAAAARDATARGTMLLVGEVQGRRPSGFDLGNSPAEVATRDLLGCDLIFATTNGTHALRACLGGRAVFAGALRNATAVATAAVASALAGTPTPYEAPSASHMGASTHQVGDSASDADAAHANDTPPDIVIVCSGRGRQPAYDDTLCAGYLLRAIQQVMRLRAGDLRLHESARIALAVLAQAEQVGTLAAALASSEAALAVEQVGLGDDLAWCAAVDTTQIVPTVTGILDAQQLLIVEPRHV